MAITILPADCKFPRKDLTGQRFGKLVALSFAGRNRNGGAVWLCRCDCGTEKTIAASPLLLGNVVSCRCANRENQRKRSDWHGQTKTRAYSAWGDMHDRCTRETRKDYAYYGGRGIRVDERWRDFKVFLADMGEAPKGMSIDRIDNAKNYGPSNCRWADRTTQANNMRSNHRLTFQGKTQTIAEWARETGIRGPIISDRLRILGWSVERSLTQPPRITRRSRETLRT